ncbi:hypothetical protein [Teredinibacter sp. KSP-S5-2]|uniref:hypothetical protein n=1 Tax=Teredinibacter sp. KSP-S5-2 TaxID=3034506 RepID=UPI0029347D7F|nr:hypothetical protein [Teredinibacter sp. KSP-S5-2]WNO08483.1 hypothetical protein P5V12_16045 [Teredinibacter sp. KSP-S5-2]
MKNLSSLLIISLLFASSLSLAKTKYVEGKFSAINPESETVFIIEKKTGDLIQYKLSSDAFNAFQKQGGFEKGEDITLQLHTKQKQSSSETKSVSGEFAGIDSQKNIIYIIEKQSKNLVGYRFDTSSKETDRIEDLKEGEKVTLSLEQAN